jgi:hypothetical protein
MGFGALLRVAGFLRPLLRSAYASDAAVGTTRKRGAESNRSMVA